MLKNLTSSSENQELMLRKFCVLLLWSPGISWNTIFNRLQIKMEIPWPLDISIFLMDQNQLYGVLVKEGLFSGDKILDNIGENDFITFEFSAIEVDACNPGADCEDYGVDQT